MSSEWLKVMLDEIARKKAEGEQAKLELQRRLDEHAARTPATPAVGPAGTAAASVPAGATDRKPPNG